MFPRLQRQNSFGPVETKSTLVISRAMELKILDGESSIPNASPVVLESINKSLETLINSHDRTKTVVHELPEFVKNTIISHCDLSEKELIDKRYGEYFEGYSLANNVQYIPVEIECLANLNPDLCKSILALFVSVVFEYITEDKNSNVFELIKWGSSFLQRLGKMLNLNDNEVLTIIRPVSESLELKQLGMNFDDLRVEKQIHINYIMEQLQPMQDSIDEFFKQTMGTFDDEDDFDYNEDFKNENIFKTDFDHPFKVSEKVEQLEFPDKDNLEKEKDKENKERDKKKDKKHSSKESKENKKKEKEKEKERKEKDKKSKKKGKEDELEKRESDYTESFDEYVNREFVQLERKSTDSNDNQEFYEVEIESEDEDEQYFKKNFVDNYKPKKKKSKELFDINDLMTYLEPDVEDDTNQVDKQVNKDKENDTEKDNKENKEDDLNKLRSDFRNDSGREELEATGASQQSDSTLVDEQDQENTTEMTENRDKTNLDYKTTDKEKEKVKVKSDGLDRNFDNYEYMDMPGLVKSEYDYTEYTVPKTPRNTLVEQEDNKEKDKENKENKNVEYTRSDTNKENHKENKEDKQKQENKDQLVMDLAELKIEESSLDRNASSSALTEGSNTNMGDVELETEEDDLLKVLEKSLKHKSSLPTNDYDNLLNDISNLNLPPKKNKSLTSKIFSNISKRINRVFSINSDKSSKVPYTSSLQSAVSFYPNQDYLNNLLLIEKSPCIVAVLVRNLVLKYIISGYNDSRVQVVFERFSNLLGVSGSSVLSIENNIVSDLAGILDVSAAKTSSKKMSRRLKILSATVGGTALLALTAGVASPVLAVGMAFLGLGGTGVSSYLNSNEGSNVLKNIFGLNVSLTHYKVKREHLTNLQFIQLNPKANMYRDSMREPESNRFSTGRDSLKSDSTRDKEDLNNNFIGICICVGNNVFLNEMFFFENDSIDFKSVETIRHLDSEYIDIWKRQFPVPISDLYLLKWESKLMASLHRMLLKLNSLSIYNKSLELYRITHNTVFTTRNQSNSYGNRNDFRDQEPEPEPENLLMFDEVRDSSGGSRYTNLEGSSGNYYSKPNLDTNKQSSEGEESQEKPTEPVKDFYKDFKDVNINWPLGLIQLCSNLDNCWLVCRNRAETCGMLMANAICDKLLTGDRHISLVGYSMGARVIFYCLLTLFQRNKLHVVKDVVLMGLPSTAGYNEWTKCTCVVAGRIINVYNENDWILAFLYRYTANYRVAGLAPVIHERVENYNATNLFKSHVDYLENISKITSFLNIHI